VTSCETEASEAMYVRPLFSTCGTRAFVGFAPVSQPIIRTKNTSRAVSSPDFVFLRAIYHS